MTPDAFYTRIVEPTIQYMAASPSIAIPATDAARVQVMAVAGQESRWQERRQLGVPLYPQRIGARSYWQFESPWGGPVAINDILQKTPVQIAAACKAFDITCDASSLYEACAWHDAIACVMARLLLWIDPAPLPAVGDTNGAWNYYCRNWRPGAPHPESWPAVYRDAMAAIGRLNQ